MGMDWRSWERNKIVMDDSLSNSQKAEMLHTTPTIVSKQRYRIVKAGGIEAFMKSFKNNKRKNSPVKPKEGSFEEEKKYLKDMGAWDLMIDIIHKNIPEQVMQVYIDKTLEKIQTGKILTAPEFFSNYEKCLQNIVIKAVACVMRSQNKENKKTTEKSKKNDFNPKVEYSPFLGVEEDYVNSLSKTIEKSKGTKVLNVSEDDNSVIIDNFKPLSVNENLWDELAKPKEAYDVIKGLYKKNKYYFNALIAFREESKKNPFKESTTYLQFYEYCEDDSRQNEPVYMIRKTSKNRLLLFMKECDVIKIFEDFGTKHEMLVDAYKYIAKLTDHNIIVLNISRPYTKTIVIDFTRLKASLRLKNGILNTLVNNKMLY